MSSANPINSASPIVVGCSGTELSIDEKKLFNDFNPVGLILFSRNIDTPGKLKELINSFKNAVKIEDPLILIDQEGGRVQRLSPPYWSAFPAMGSLGDRFLDNQTEAEKCTYLNFKLIAKDLSELGINFNCAPVIDVPAPQSHKVIGNRAFSSDPKTVARLGRSACNGLVAGSIAPIVKHIPGHGRACVDSHVQLPVVPTTQQELMEIDFYPFKYLNDVGAAMTAHILYPQLDRSNPASTSKTIINSIIRKQIGFNGLLFSDDLCMEALPGKIQERAEKTLAAGCDIALHCNGNFAEMLKIAEKSFTFSNSASYRLKKIKTAVTDSEEFDVEAAKARISAFLKEKKLT